ncbi:hypothetical protein HANVADRAFT_80958 [Hanseniaspora valbyensis NRRL Y-1626]|uniref:Uncharacterized protein n=1 Tax=Hanseniaspora valbyensis NRRL Y-1626 TaxID=766949 RepID=A0A1B7TCK5_9ASCO|nr:hypothetical protein HANVADRAFT_80958 [Hanseniaspora valbyensis NRRL Y-1626]
MVSAKSSKSSLSNSNSPNNESIKSFKEFKTIKLLKNRDVSGASTDTAYNILNSDFDNDYNDAYNQLTYNESKNTNCATDSGLDSNDSLNKKKKKRRSYNSSLIRSSIHSDSYSIFNGKNRLSIAIFSDLDCVSVKDDATIIDLDGQAKEDELKENLQIEEEEEGEVDDRFGDLLKPLRRYNSHESILSCKQVLTIESEKLSFKEKPRSTDSLYLGSFTKREEKFKRSYNYLRNGQLSYLTSQPMIALNNKKAVTSTTNKIMDSSVFSSPFMLPLRSSTKKEKVNFKTSDSLREYLNPPGSSTTQIKEDRKDSFKQNTNLTNIKTTKIDETTIDFETKTIKRKSSIIWDLPKKTNIDYATTNQNNNDINRLNKNPFVNKIPKRQPSLIINGKGKAILDNGTQVLSSDIQMDLLQDALADI